MPSGCPINPPTARAYRAKRPAKTPHFMARRSYSYYRLALSDGSYARVSEEEGSTEQFVRSHFYGKSTKEEAQKNFRLKPTAFDPGAFLQSAP